MSRALLRQIAAVSVLALGSATLPAGDKPQPDTPATPAMQRSFHAVGLGQVGAGSQRETAPGKGGPRVGGDVCETATVIDALPFHDTGNTCGFANDYDEVCPYSGSNSPDVAYAFTPAGDTTIDITLCNGSNYDTKLYVYEGGCPGTLVACNDDFCPGYVSELADVELAGGTTYYIIVDGYGGECGDYVLDVTIAAPPETLQCPGDSLYAQEPSRPQQDWTFANSEAYVNGTSYLRYESFDHVFGNIQTVTWWGLMEVLSGYQWLECTDSDPRFRIRFYEDAGGMPGAVVADVTVTPTQTHSGVLYGDKDVTVFSADLPDAVTLRSGWISIQGLGDTDCWFMWLSASDWGAGHSWLSEGGGALEDQPFDLSLCLGGQYVPVFGACCDDATGDCAENVEVIDCLGPLQRFVEGGTCADLDPPCGTVIGACCHEDGTCEEVVEAACVGDATWLGPYTTCDQCPCQVICPDGGAAESETCGETTNDGCNMSPPTFEPITPGVTVCGTAWYDGSTRDTDWYAIHVDEPVVFTFTVQSEFHALFGLVEQLRDGVAACDQITGYINPAGSAQDCQVASVTTGCLPAGDYWFFVAPMFEADVTCPGNYLATLTTEPCTLPTGACCFADGSCLDDLTVYDCTDAHGDYQGDGTTCATADCPVLPDDCAAAQPIGEGSVSFDTTIATYDHGPGYCIADGPNIWYCYTASCSGHVIVSLCASLYDTRLAVYDGCDCATATEIGCNDDACGNTGLQSLVEFEAVAGRQYLIEIGGYDGAAGVGTLNITCEPTPSGACCVGTDCVGDMTGYECGQMGGVWYEGETCASFECPAMVPNDDCADAEPIGEVTDLPFDTTLSTHDGPGQCVTSGGNLWYCYTPSCSGQATVSLCGSSFDTRLGAYLGCDCDNPLLLACNDDYCGLQSQVSFPVVAGAHYLIEVGGFTSQFGPGVLTVTCAPGETAACCVGGTCIGDITEPECDAAGGTWFAGESCDTFECPQPSPGDDCTTPIVADLSVLPFTDENSTCGRGNTYDNTCLLDRDTGEDAIYELVVSEPTCVNITLDSSEWWSTMAVATDCPPTDCLAIANTGDNPDRINGLALEPGTYYLIIDSLADYAACADYTLEIAACPAGACCVDGECVGVMMEFECDTLGGMWFEGETCDTVDCPAPPPNDDCAAAICVADGEPLAGTTVYATGDDVTSCASNDYADVWFVYTPTVSGSVTVSLCGSSFDTSLAVFSACDGQELICNDDACGLQSEVTLTLTAGTAYYIRVAGYGGATGDYVLTVTGGEGGCACGDLDGDGDVDLDDYHAFLAAFGSCEGDPAYDQAADFDGDGCVTLVDYQMWVACYRDANPGAPLGSPLRSPTRGTSAGARRR